MANDTAAEHFSHMLKIDLHSLLQNLSFDFKKSLPNTENSAEWSEYRIRYHRNVESIRNQMVYTASLMKKLKPDLQIAVLSPDIYPQSSEVLLSLLLEKLLEFTTNITIISRRGEDIRDTKFCENLNTQSWKDPLTFSQYHLIFVLCSSANLPIVQEISTKQLEYEHTVFFVSSVGVNYNRAKYILNTANVLLPNINHQPNPGDKSFPQTLQLQFEKAEAGFACPDREILKAVLLKFLQKDKAPLQQIIDELEAVLPSNTVQGVHEATVLNSSRLQYYYNPLYLEKVERHPTPGELAGNRGMVKSLSDDDTASEISKLVLKSRQMPKK